MPTIRISPEASTKLIEIMGAMQFKKRRPVPMHEVITEVLEAIPKKWYDGWFTW